MYRGTYVEVDVANLKHNINELIKCCPKYKYFFGVVKGNAYGHGYEIAKYLLDTKINYLAVASLEEALEVRKYNKQTPILCLEPISVAYLDICIQNNVAITVHCIEYVESLKKWLSENKIEGNNTLKIHIKIDSGMNRLGFKDNEEVNAVYNDFVLNKVNNVLAEGIYTHFATTGFLDKEWDNQLDNFKKITKGIDLTKIPIVHLDRSITCVTHPNIEFANGARFGLAMYGYTVDKKTKPVTIKDKLLELKHKRTKQKYNISEVDLDNIPTLKPVLSLKTNIIQIKKIKKGEFVGYGAMYRAKEDEYIATLPIGYADGIDLRNLGRMVYINSNPYKIVGTVCMGMISVKVDERVKLGDVVEIIGRNIDAQIISKYTGQSTYSVITNISYEVPRKYIES